MGKLARTMASVEAIDFQKNALLFNELTLAFEGIRKEGVYTDAALKTARISEIIQRHTNIKTKAGVDTKMDGYNAYIYPPGMDNNHPMVNHFRRGVLGDKDSRKALRKVKDKKLIEGSVDLVGSKVHGVFADIELKFYLTAPILADGKFTPAELAAITLHEIGHAFTYFEYLGSTVSTNYALLSVTEEFLGTKDREKRIQILKNTEKDLGVVINNPADLAEQDDAEIVYTVLLKATTDEVRSETGTFYHDLTGWEYLSDQFASRHGAAKDLAVALDKMMRSYGHHVYMSTPGFMMLEGLKAALVIGGMLVPGAQFAWLRGASIFILSCSVLGGLAGTQYRDYDDPQARIQRIRNQILESLKDRKLNKEQKKAHLENLDVVDDILKHMKDKVRLVDLLWRAILPKHRNQIKQERLQKELENLAANKLYASSIRLNTLTA